VALQSGELDGSQRGGSSRNSDSWLLVTSDNRALFGSGRSWPRIRPGPWSGPNRVLDPPETASVPATRD
jgi:hypothetical protein